MSGEGGDSPEPGNLFLSFLASWQQSRAGSISGDTLGSVSWAVCPVTRGLLMMTQTLISLQTMLSHPQSREQGEESPLMSKLANNHSQRNIIVFHPQCLNVFWNSTFCERDPVNHREQTHLNKAKEEQQLCYLKDSFLVSFNNVVLTERGNVSMYLRSERGFIWKIAAIN